MPTKNTKLSPRQMARFAFLRSLGHAAQRSYWAAVAMIGGGR